MDKDLDEILRSIEELAKRGKVTRNRALPHSLRSTSLILRNMMRLNPPPLMAAKSGPGLTRGTLGKAARLNETSPSLIESIN